MTHRTGAAKLWIVLLCLFVGFLAGVLVGWKRGIPFVGQSTQWSVGIYTGKTPFALQPADGLKQPVVTAADVKGIPARFVADPFLVHEDSKWYLYTEIWRNDTDQGDLGVFTSDDCKHWKFGQIVLDESFHLSYPHVFKARDGNYYMIPETAAKHAIRLYKADPFPTHFTHVKDIIQGDFADPSTIYYQGKYWIFAVAGFGDLHVFYADDLTGPWTEHPKSPVVACDPDISRPGGRMLIDNGHLYRFTQDTYPSYGNQLRAYEITTLTTIDYAEKPVQENAILKASGDGWNARGMHQIDVQQLPDGSWIACVDGQGDVRSYGLQY